MKEELRRIRAQMNLSGLNRREAARALHLSYSALNRKLRGEIALTPEEASALREMSLKKGGLCP